MSADDERPASFLDAVRRLRPVADGERAPAPPARDPFAADPFASSPGYGRAALDRETLNVATAANGTREVTLNTAAFNLGMLVNGGVLTEGEVIDAMVGACSSNGWVAEEGVQAVHDKVRRAVADTAGKPRGVPERPAGLAPAFPAASGPPDPFGPAAPATAPPDPHSVRVAHYLADLRAREDAKALLEAERHRRAWREPAYTSSVADELALPDEPVAYALEELLPVGGNALLAAGFKTGKTTTINELVRSHTDGAPFLGRFAPHPAPGRIAIFNYEVDRGQYRRWLRDLELERPDRAVVLNLRGFRLPLTVPEVEAWAVEWLKRHEVSTLVVDPFARAFTGLGKENDNDDVGVFLDTLDVVKERAGVRDLVLVTHTGREQHEQGSERARGATRLDDWPDVRWLLTKDDEGTRYFRATGRDVEVEEEALTFDPATRRLTLAGGDRTWTAVRRLEEALVAFVKEHPGCAVKELEQGVGGNKAHLKRARDNAVSSGLIRLHNGPKNAVMHYPAGTIPDPFS